MQISEANFYYKAKMSFGQVMRIHSMVYTVWFTQIISIMFFSSLIKYMKTIAIENMNQIATVHENNTWHGALTCPGKYC